MLPVRKYQNRTNPGDIDEFWTTQNSINIQRTKFEGDLVNGLSTGSSQTIISEGTTVGSVPPAVPLPAPPSVTLSSRILDGVQLALDIGGLVPVVGEACDLTNVLIHVARGNKAEALISAAAMIPVAGAAVVSGKFASKATKALAKNADKLDDVAEAVKSIPDGSFCNRSGLGAAESWGRPETLAKHFRDHGADFGSTSAEHYAQQASQFLQESQARGLPTKVDAQGIIRVYDPATNTFGAYNPNGTTRTFFKPTRGQAYWNDNLGVAPWGPR